MFYVFSKMAPGVCLAHYMTEGEAKAYAEHKTVLYGYYTTDFDATEAEKRGIEQYNDAMAKRVRRIINGPCDTDYDR